MHQRGRGFLPVRGVGGAGRAASADEGGALLVQMSIIGAPLRVRASAWDTTGASAPNTASSNASHSPKGRWRKA